VSPTPAGEHLMRTVAPRIEEIDAEMAALSDFRDKPSGVVRITATGHAVTTVLWPRLKGFLATYPDIRVEISVDLSLKDIVAERFDAGVRFGEQVAKDMIAMRIGPDVRMAVVAAPAYLEGRLRPRTPHDLTAHRCINLRLPTYGGLYAWEFERDGRELKVRVDGQLVFNDLDQIQRATLDGFGFGYLPEDAVNDLLTEGRLVRVLEDWCAPFAGYHLYYPSRRQPSAAFALLVEALRFRPALGNS